MLDGWNNKMRICVHNQRGRCTRPNCKFVHGDAELRPLSGGSYFNGRRDYRSADLRDKFARKHSPHRRYSPGRDARNYSFQKPTLHDRGMSRSRSPVKRGERRHGKKQHMDGETDRISDGVEDHKREDKLKQLHSDIERLEDHNSELKILLEEKDNEANKLSKRNEDLEIQLNKDQEDCKRITSKIKKFVRAHGRYIKAQEELKRSQACFVRLGHQLGSDVLSDVELNGGGRRSSRNDETKNNASPFKKRTHVLSAISEDAKTGNSQKRGRFSSIFSRSEELIRSEGPTIHLEMDNKDTEPMKAVQNKKDVHKSLMDDYKMNREVNYGGINPSNNVKSSEGGRSLPSTSIAAHAVDELIEAIETERSEVLDVYVAHENGASDNKATPPVNQIAYKQYKGHDEYVDAEKVDNEMLDIGLNSEVEIEQI